MYCINCGVKLADTEKQCPLCNTVVYHPDLTRPPAEPLYPENKVPESRSDKKILCVALIFAYLFPLVLCFISDLQTDGRLDWFGYVLGALLVTYTIFCLPLWFKKPSPIVLIPSGFAVTTLYLLYISLATDGHWFLTFAFPLIGGCCVILCAVVILLRFAKKGKLYVIGGALIAFGAMVVLTEYLLKVTFSMSLLWWSVYPLSVLVLLGSIMIYLAISKTARETLERKFFF